MAADPTHDNAAEYKARLDLAISRGWLLLHDGTYVEFTPAGAELFA